MSGSFAAPRLGAGNTPSPTAHAVGYSLTLLARSNSANPRISSFAPLWLVFPFMAIACEAAFC